MSLSSVPKVPGLDGKVNSDPVPKKNGFSSSSSSLLLQNKVRQLQALNDDESERSQTVSNYSKMTPVGRDMSFRNEECTFGRAAGLKSRIQETTFGRKHELSKSITDNLGRQTAQNLKEQ